LAHAGGFGFLGAEHGSAAYKLFFYIPCIIAVVTAFYMTRCWMLTFWGKPRNQHLYDHAHEASLLYIPLIVLAVPSIIAGYRISYIQSFIESATDEGSKLVLYMRDVPPESEPYKKYDLYAQAWPSKPGGSHRAVSTPAAEGAKPEELTHSQHQYERAHNFVETWVFWAFAVGIGAGIAIYFNGYAVAN